MKFAGHLDSCHHSHVAGWAARAGVRVPVTVRVNGETLTDDAPSVRRADLAPHGIAEDAGFSFGFPEPLAISDTVEALFPDGSHLRGSPSTGHRVRLRELLDGITPSMEGMEIGPLSRPTLSKKKYRVWYTDHADRDELIRKYRHSATSESLDSDAIVPVDIVWPGGPLALCLPEPRTFDYALASHVVEHVPDVLGWLQQIASVLRDGGLLSLAIPDKERTFDHLRAVSRPADLIEAHVRRLRVPSARHVFDAITSASPFGEPVKPPSTMLIVQALQHARAVEATDLYLDVHCYVFTPESFCEVFAIVACTGLVPFRLRRLFPTRPGANEFIVSLEKTNDGPEEIAASYRSVDLAKKKN